MDQEASQAYDLVQGTPKQPIRLMQNAPLEQNGNPVGETEQMRQTQLLIFGGTELRIRLANAAAQDALGYGLDELGSLSFLDLALDLSEPAWRRLINRMTQGGRDLSGFQTNFLRKDGSRYAALVQLERITSDSEALYHATIEPSGSHPEAASRLNAALLRSVIDTAPDAIVTIGDDGLIASFSPAAERMFGYRADEVIGQNVSLLMPEPYRSQHNGYLSHYMETGEKRIIGIGRTVIARHRSGRTFPIELAVGEVHTGADQLFTGFIRDISDRVAAQTRANKLQQELNHVGRLTAMGEIASLIVHELNQPLTAIANFGEAAKRLVEAGGKSAARSADLMEKSVRQAHRASDMIRRLRSFVSRGVAEMEPIVVNEVVREAARLALIGAANQQIDARFELSDDLSEIRADRVQVQQVVVNLIRNAVDAMLSADSERAGGLGLTVATDQTEAGDILISVADTGPGIAPDVAQDVFTPFVTTKPGGMGIGLSVSKSIIEGHGGRIWAEPNPGGGTRFLFTLSAGRGGPADR